MKISKTTFDNCFNKRVVSASKKEKAQKLCNFFNKKYGENKITKVRHEQRT
jgi:hypothetical protein